MQKLETLEVSPVQNLMAMHRGLNTLDSQIAEAEETFGIKAMKDRRSQLALEYSEELDRIAPVLEYSEDKFLKALKKKGESYREGSIKIMRTSRTIRNVLTEKFATAFPDLLKSVCKIELTKADALVGKKTMDAFVTKETTYRYEVVDMELEKI
jgi:hypothetical protein